MQRRNTECEPVPATGRAAAFELKQGERVTEGQPRLLNWGERARPGQVAVH